MKILASIGIIQLAAIVLLYGKIASLEDELSRMPAANTTNVAATGSNAGYPARDPAGSSPLPDEMRLRQIIREELAARVDAQPALQPPEAGDGPRAGADPAEIQALRDSVAAQLELYSSVGTVTDAQMQRLQADIARLDPQSRSEMLGALSRAINSGRLDARL